MLQHPRALQGPISPALSCREAARYRGGAAGMRRVLKQNPSLASEVCGRPVASAQIPAVSSSSGAALRRADLCNRLFTMWRLYARLRPIRNLNLAATRARGEAKGWDEGAVELCAHVLISSTIVFGQ